MNFDNFFNDQNQEQQTQEAVAIMDNIDSKRLKDIPQVEKQQQYAKA